MSCQRREKYLLILLGKRGAGKTTLAKALVCDRNFVHYEMSTIIRSIRHSMGYDHLKLRAFVSMMHKFESGDFAIDYMYRANYFRYRDTVITGIRNKSELSFIYSHLSDFNIRLIYLSPGFFIRLQRSVLRKERSSILTFLIEELYSIKWRDKALREQATIFSNKGNLADTIRSFYKLISLG